MDKENLYKNSFDKCDADQLVDIDILDLEKDCSKEEKARIILEKIENPYFFRSGTIAIKVMYKEHGERLQNMLVKLTAAKMQEEKQGGNSWKQ